MAFSFSPTGTSPLKTGVYLFLWDVPLYREDFTVVFFFLFNFGSPLFLFYFWIEIYLDRGPIFSTLLTNVLFYGFDECAPLAHFWKLGFPSARLRPFSFRISTLPSFIVTGCRAFLARNEKSKDPTPPFPFEEPMDDQRIPFPGDILRFLPSLSVYFQKDYLLPGI